MLHYKDSPLASFTTNVKIVDDLGTVLLDQSNAIHPQNMARIFARALANEGRSSIYRVALGNGGTVSSVGGNITYKAPNDGSTSIGWQSRLYNETYTEVVDETSNQLGHGSGAVPGNDPSSVGLSGPGVRSSEQGLLSLVTVDMTLNPAEPNSPSQTIDDEGTYVFDELGLYTEGLSNVNTRGYQRVLLENKALTDNTGLVPSQSYQFTISVNGGGNKIVVITMPLVGSGVLGMTTYITYGDILPIMNDALRPLGVVATMTDPVSKTGTDGNLVLTSNTVGPGSSVVISTDGVTPLFNRLIGFIEYEIPVAGKLAGVQNDSSDVTILRERLLTHIIFAPITKKRNRTLRLIYTLRISVAKTVQEPQ